MEKQIQLVLASGSPRRKELMQSLFVPFEILVANIEEKTTKIIPSDVAMDLALQKANVTFDMALKKWEKPLVISADTIVVIDDRFLGKPKSLQEAKETLSLLSGKKHQVFTGVCLKSKERVCCFFEKTDVYFEQIDAELLEFYLQTGDSLDKARAYGIQGKALSFIQKIEGSYSNVVGLPVNVLIQKLEEFLGDKTWRKQLR